MNDLSVLDLCAKIEIDVKKPNLFECTYQIKMWISQ
jgi:hypothetical protein